MLTQDWCFGAAKLYFVSKGLVQFSLCCDFCYASTFPLMKKGVHESPCRDRPVVRGGEKLWVVSSLFAGSGGSSPSPWGNASSGVDHSPPLLPPNNFNSLPSLDWSNIVVPVGVKKLVALPQQASPLCYKNS